MRAIFILMVIVSISFTASAQLVQNPKFAQKIENTIDKTIPTISCSQLNKKMQSSKVYILDAREKNEYNVSHLYGAKWVGFNTFSSNYVSRIPKDATVVLYCSIGYRSEKIGEKLEKMGYKKVYNLYGGIFEWSNRQYKLVNNKSQSTKKVHAYDKEWGKWVEKGDKVY